MCIWQSGMHDSVIMEVRLTDQCTVGPSSVCRHMKHHFYGQCVGLAFRPPDLVCDAWEHCGNGHICSTTGVGLCGDWSRDGSFPQCKCRIKIYSFIHFCGTSLHELGALVMLVFMPGVLHCGLARQCMYPTNYQPKTQCLTHKPVSALKYFP